ncbi:hypothetical protein Pcinc_026195 [Petrolisthes cinctipes]|uniref:Uncharacterized protein n=1 Tax=Petrolisthes cinctipes TaxID=88211 RepID=A0AAE1F7R2_PETCI|nr:hypothetical protein Pcinc_026195 [Petrolisthes cinctipes]
MWAIHERSAHTTDQDNNEPSLTSFNHHFPGTFITSQLQSSLPRNLHYISWWTGIESSPTNQRGEKE